MEVKTKMLQYLYIKKFTIQRLNWVKISLCDILFFELLKNKSKGNFFLQNYLKLFFFFKIDSFTLDPDPNWATILDPDSNLMYLDPQHCLKLIIIIEKARI